VEHDQFIVPGEPRPVEAAILLLLIYRWEMPMPEQTTDVSASPEEVWALLSDTRRTAEWLAPVQTLDDASDSPLAVGQSYKVAMTGRLPATSLRVHAAEPNRELRCTVGMHFTHPIGLAMRAEVRLAPADAGTSVTVELACNPVTGRMQEAIAGINIGAALEETTDRIKRIVEAS
jgi:uncharacterized protein YndB with AHSA1/START domain